jgi:hypothetical protein
VQSIGFADDWQDINVLRLEEHSRRRTKLKGLTKAEGINVGSMLIDFEVRRKIAADLSARGAIGTEEELVWIAGDMMDDCGFEGLKCAFNGEWSPDDIHMRIPPSSGIRRDLGTEVVLSRQVPDLSLCIFLTLPATTLSRCLISRSRGFSKELTFKFWS